MESWVTLEEALDAASERWAERVLAGDMKETTAAFYVAHGDRFVKFAKAHGVETVDQITADLCTSFMFAGATGTYEGDPRRGNIPVEQTQRNRLVAIKSMTIAAKQRGIRFPEGDPTAGIRVAQRRVPANPRPLSPGEVGLLRSRAGLRLTDTLHPAQIELALAGATQQEIIAFRVRDFDEENGSIFLGLARNDSREILLEPSAIEVLKRRKTALVRKARGALDLDAPLACSTDPRFSSILSLSPRMAKSLRDTMNAAGILRAGVSPSSMLDFAANRHYAQTDRIESVTAFLGRRSLDKTMRLIDEEWQAQYAAIVVSDESLPRRVS